jgi:NAD(P)-dependent dehydrogenase (short-subunit alcohol dehydrogenase family)
MTTMSLLQLEDLVAVVTGAASGIGLAVVAAMRREGARVAALDVNLPEPRDGVLSLVCDVTDGASVDAAVASAAAHFGAIDILINNAGIGAQGTVEDNDIAEWQRVFDVNVFGMVRMARACLPHLRRSKHPAIVNTASIVSWTGLPKRACYGASKGAVYALTLAMAADHAAERIRVNCVCPGTVDTPWVGRLLAAAPDPAAARANLVARQPIGRLGTAEEIAVAIAYLASPAAGYTTGSALQIDGGTHGFLVPPVGRP